MPTTFVADSVSSASEVLIEKAVATLSAVKSGEINVIFNESEL